MTLNRFLLLAPCVCAVFAAPRVAPTVNLDDATFIGTTSGRTSQFLGIPFARPPTGDLRFRLPQPNSPYSGNIDATEYGPSCPQQALTLPVLTGLAGEAADWLLNSIYTAVIPDDEDCLTINVIAPSSATPSSELPVIVWILAGGFEVGSTFYYPGKEIVEQSIDLGLPAIYVSMNYRMSAFGFLGGKEVKAEGVGNLGLQDQRQALRWIQQYIGAFGGDPSKVMIWGESSGAISAALQMLSNGGDTEGLFRAAFMQSGAPIPVGDIEHGQKYYDALVSQTGCSRTSDTLACLRTVPYPKLKAAMNQSPSLFSYQSLNLAWLPRVDGVFLKDDPQKLVAQGSVANVPFITGNCDDEGTIFALASTNVTTDAEFVDYIQNTVWSGLPSALDMNQLASFYTNDVADGSPFNTSFLYDLTPQYKRIAALLGDAVFIAPRRYFVQQRSGQQPVWAYLSKREKILPFLGSAHGTDLLNVYGGGDMANYLIRFAVNLDPNGDSDIDWPRYTTSSPKMLLFKNTIFTSQDIINDDYRSDAMNFLTSFTFTHPL